MHAAVTTTFLHRTASTAALVATLGAATAQAQQPVAQSSAAAASVRADAEQFLRRGDRTSAVELLGRWLSEHPTDGASWSQLGRIYLADGQRWHREGHLLDPDGMLLLEFASAAFEQAQQLLVDSGTVYRVLVAVEQMLIRLEAAGWEATMINNPLAAEQLPLPPVLAELGANLIASCPVNGVLVTGSLVETAAVWGTRLGYSSRDDLILVRPDMYGWDAAYRVRMAEALGVPLDQELPAALATVATRRPVCLTPAVDSITAPALAWRPLHLVLASSPASDSTTAELTVHQLASTGLAGSVWSSAVRDVYDLAARRNRGLCLTLLAAGDSPGLPSIAACPRE
ncbi:MAG: hypothetical protein SFU57_06040 [Gemmatimonadales bacterium]|nr:hypothetical protein [Gemmatimonadales bacterium]